MAYDGYMGHVLLYEDHGHGFCLREERRLCMKIDMGMGSTWSLHGFH
jgi:hypothetical protein